jgi:hypothetical protein
MNIVVLRKDQDVLMKFTHPYIIQVPQVVECLRSKHRTLSSNSSTTKKKLSIMLKRLKES